MPLKIIGVSLGTIENVYYAENTLQANFDKGQIIVHSPCWYIEGGKKILVETGYRSVEWFMSHIPSSGGSVWQTARRTREQELPRALEPLGVTPEDIDIVINTHLHFDHCGQNYLFKNAEFIVQREEYRNAFMPFTGQEWAYASPLAFPGEMPPFWGTPFKFIEGDVEIADGVKCVTLPGHTPGSQGVLVTTDKGNLLIAGDHFPLYENWEKRIPTGYVDDVQEWYRSYDKVKALGARPIAQHDARNFQTEKYPVFG